MKKLVILFSLVFLSLSSFAQGDLGATLNNLARKANSGNGAYGLYRKVDSTAVNITLPNTTTTATTALTLAQQNSTNLTAQQTTLATKQDRINSATFVALSTSRYLTDADNEKKLVNSGGGTITITVSNTLTLPFTCELIQKSTGPIAVAVSGGMILQNNAGNNRTAGQWTLARLTIQSGTDVILSGQTDLAAGEYIAFVDDNFTRSNTTPPTGIGSPPTYSTPSVGGGWIDPSQTFRILNNTLSPGTGSTSVTTRGPQRPVSENLLPQAVSITTGPITSSAVTSIPYQFELRQVVDPNYSSAILVSMNVNTTSQTAVVSIGNSSGTSSYGMAAQPSFAIVSGHSYIITAKAESLYAGGFTVCFYNVVDAASPSTVLSQGAVYLPFNTSMFISNLGQAGVVQNRSDITRSDLAVLTDFQLQKKSSLGLNTIQSGVLVTSTSGNYVTVSGSNSWVAGSTTFALSGAASTGASITSTSIISSKLARLTITTGSATGLLRITEGGTTNSVDINVGASATGSLVATNIIVQPSSSTATVNMSLGIITGGKAPYTGQWYRSATWSDAPASMSLLSGQTSPDLVDSPPTGQVYAYKYVVTDVLSSTAVTVAAPGMRGYVEKPATVYVPVTPRTVKLGYGGDSNLGNESLGLRASVNSKITATGSVTIASYANAAVSGSYSTQWLPGTANYNAAKSSFSAISGGGPTHIIFMLGTNDAGSFALSKATYMSNMNTIMAQFATDFPSAKVVLMTPQLYLRSGTGDAQTNLIQYVDALDQIVAANANCYRGDRNFMVYSYGRFNLYSDTIHMSTTGYSDMAQYWADAFTRRIDGL